MLIAGGLLVWLVVSGRIDWSVFTQLRLDLALLAAFGCRVLAAVTHTLRWRALCRAQDLDLPVGAAIRIGLVGRFFALAVPPLLAVDSSRTYYAVRRNAGRSPEVLSSVLVDRVLGLSTLGVLAVIGGWLVRGRGSSTVDVLLPISAAIAVLPVAVVILVATRTRWPLHRVPILDRLVTAMEQYRHRRGDVARAAALSFVSHGAVMAGAYALFVTLDVSAGIRDVLGIHPLVSIAQAIPTTPLGLGVVDVVAEELYGLVQIVTGAELILLTRAVDLAIGALSSLAFLFPVGVSSAIAGTPAEVSRREGK